jgi:hypothetical protein
MKSNNARHELQNCCVIPPLLFVGLGTCVPIIMLIELYLFSKGKGFTKLCAIGL